MGEFTEVTTRLRKLGRRILGRKPFEFPPHIVWEEISKDGAAPRRPSVTRGRRTTSVPKRFALERVRFAWSPTYKLHDGYRTLGKVYEPRPLRAIFGGYRALRGQRFEWKESDGTLLATARRSIKSKGAKTTIRDRRGQLLGTIEETSKDNIFTVATKYVIRDDLGNPVASTKKLRAGFKEIVLMRYDKPAVNIRMEGASPPTRVFVTVEDSDALHPAVAVFVGALRTAV